MAEKKPTFYMMVGVPGSGKTTYAHRIPNAKVLSSDDIRKELGVDGGDKQAHGRVFAILHERVKEALQNGKDVVYDATNITSFRRKNFLKEINDLAGKKVCIYLAPTLAQAIRQNADRDEPVPEQVVRDMDMKLEAPTFSEGWDEMKLMKTLPQRNIDRIRSMTAKEYAEYMYSDYGLLKMNRDLGSFLSKEQFVNNFVQWLNSPVEDSNDVL